MTLLVAYRSKNDLICWKEIEEANRHTNVRVVTTLTREDARNEGFLKGRPDNPMLEEVINQNYQDTIFMTCGPQGLMDLVTSHLQTHQVPKEHILTESFD